MKHTLVDYCANEKELRRIRAATQLQPRIPGAPPMGPATPPKNPSPMAKGMADHVAKHIQDPLGSTQDMFQNLGQAQLMYELQKENARRSLAGPKAVIQHVEDMHELNPDEENGYQEPGTPQGQGMPGSGNGMGPGQGPGIPPNMAQTPGKMNMNRPSQAGFQPGVSPGMEQTVRPGKMGQPTPGGQANPGFPGRGTPGQPQNNPPAPKPKGAGQLPKKPGTQMSKGKNGNGSGRSIKVHIQSAADYGIKPKVQSLKSIMAGVDLHILHAKGKICARCGKMHAMGNCKMSATAALAAKRHRH